MMSYWTFSDVFEEQGVAKTPFHGGFGLLAVGGIPKPSYNAFALMHLLGDVRIGDPAQNVLVTRRKDGTLVLAVWNLVDPGTHGNDREVHLTFSHVKPHAHVSIHRLDASHGDVLIAYQKMGSPRYPTPAQIQEMRKASQMGPPERAKLKNGNLTLDLPVNGLAVIEVK
jgi:xylan 1,4-beta-xylosidase